MTHVSRSVSYRDVMANYQPWSSVKPKNTYALYFHVSNFSMSSLSARVRVSCSFHFDVMAATVCSVICQCCSNKQESKFWINCLSQFVCWIINTTWCIQTTQVVHSNLFNSPLLTFSVNSVEFCNISKYVSWCNRILKSLPIPSPMC